MAHQSITFEWQIADDDRWWDDLPTLPEETKPRAVQPLTGELRLIGQVSRTLALLGVALLLVTSLARAPAEEQRIRWQTAIHQALALEERAWQQNDAAFYDQLIDEKASSQWRSEWRTFWTIDPQARETLGMTLVHVEPLADFVKSEVLVTSPSPEWWRSSPYREIRFYRAGDAGVIRTMPAASFWGKLRTYETAHLHFEFHEHDRPLVEQIAAGMEQSYVQLHQWLDVKLPTAHTKLNFEIVPESASGWMAEGDHYEISSPIVAKVPADLTDAEFLAHNITSRLVYRVMSSGRDGRSSTSAAFRWRTVQWALNGWLRTELLQQRSPWHQQATAGFRTHLQTRWPLSLKRLIELSSDEPRDRVFLMAQYMEAESLIAYLVATEGRAILPVLLRSLGKYNTWEELLPHITPQDASVFEANWNVYLAQTYGITRNGAMQYLD